MRKVIIASFLIIILSYVYGVDTQYRTTSFLNYYYTVKDDSIIDDTINYLNSNPELSDIDQFKLASFYIALFSENPELRIKFIENVVNIKYYNHVIIYAFQTDSAELLENTEVSSTWNDVYWNMLFASGNFVYLDRIIDNIKYNDEREDINKFMAGASAKWSIASNIHQHKVISEYISVLLKDGTDKAKYLEDLFVLDLEKFSSDTREIIAKFSR